MTHPEHPDHPEHPAHPERPRLSQPTPPPAAATTPPPAPPPAFPTPPVKVTADPVLDAPPAPTPPYDQDTEVPEPHKSEVAASLPQQKPANPLAKAWGWVKGLFS